MKLTVSKSKNSASFYVQKTIRKSNGSVTTVTVEKLGNLDEVKAKAKGQDPYIWAQQGNGHRGKRRRPDRGL